ncbi:hypothetical protein [Caballeronia sp. GACF4]|uniref:hypothetical protein n=1 Tax=Caballeronia sp. GACF4 TaxID=2921763 RepID=UPI002029261B|nr:hypothetical protein [Caballeronia sp. GACF4]
MFSIICKECGAEARTEVANCPRCGFVMEKPAPEIVEASKPALRMPRRLRDHLSTVAAWTTVCLVALAGITLWSTRTSGDSESGAVAVGKIETDENRMTADTAAVAASTSRP